MKWAFFLLSIFIGAESLWASRHDEGLGPFKTYRSYALISDGTDTSELRKTTFFGKNDRYHTNYGKIGDALGARDLSSLQIVQNLKSKGFNPNATDSIWGIDRRVFERIPVADRPVIQWIPVDQVERDRMKSALGELKRLRSINAPPSPLPPALHLGPRAKVEAKIASNPNRFSPEVVQRLGQADGWNTRAKGQYRYGFGNRKGSVILSTLLVIPRWGKTVVVSAYQGSKWMVSLLKR